MSNKKEPLEEIVDFEILKENFNVYELEDDSIIKTKFILSFIIKTNERLPDGRNKYSFSNNNIISVFSPIDIRGKSDKNYPVSELEKYIVEKNLKFRQISDGGWNEYKTKKSILRIRNRVKSIDKTSKFDSKGYPSYIVRSETEFLINDLKETSPKVDS